MKMSNELHDSWGEARVGDTLPELRRLVTQEHVARYAEASGDHNPLHIDPEFAQGTPYGRTIAHGLLTLSFVSQLMTRWDWEGWSHGGELDVAFVGPLYPGDTVVVEATVASIEERDDIVLAVCNIRCVAEDRTVLVGTAARGLERREG